MWRIGMAGLLASLPALADVSPSGRAIDPRRLGLVRTLTPHTQHIYGCLFTRDARWLVTHSADGTVAWIRCSTGRLERTLRLHAISLALSPDGRTLAASTNDGHVEFFEAATGGSLRKAQGEPGFAQQIQFSPDGKHVAAHLPESASIQVWEVESGKLVRTLEGASESSSAILFTPDSAAIFYVGAGGAVLMRSMRDGAELGRFETQGEPVSMALSRDGRELMTGVAGGKIRLWETVTKKELTQFDSPAPQQTPILAVSDDRRFLYVGAGSRLHVMDPRNGAIAATVKHHTAAIQTIAVSPDRRFLATVAGDYQVKLWGTVPGGMSRATPKGFLGVSVVGEEEGCLVSEVIPNTAAEQLGLRVGDKLKKVAGIEIKSSSHAIAQIGLHGVGEEIEIVIERDGGDKTFRAKLGPRPANMDE
jgi:WD40 repeat protein